MAWLRARMRRGASRAGRGERGGGSRARARGGRARTAHGRQRHPAGRRARCAHRRAGAVRAARRAAGRVQRAGGHAGSAPHGAVRDRGESGPPDRTRVPARGGGRGDGFRHRHRLAVRAPCGESGVGAHHRCRRGGPLPRSRPRPLEGAAGHARCGVHTELPQRPHRARRGAEREPLRARRHRGPDHQSLRHAGFVGWTRGDDRRALHPRGGRLHERVPGRTRRGAQLGHGLPHARGQQRARRGLGDGGRVGPRRHRRGAHGFAQHLSALGTSLVPAVPVPGARVAVPAHLQRRAVQGAYALRRSQRVGRAGARCGGRLHAQRGRRRHRLQALPARAAPAELAVELHRGRVVEALVGPWRHHDQRVAQSARQPRREVRRQRRFRPREPPARLPLTRDRAAPARRAQRASRGAESGLRRRAGVGHLHDLHVPAHRGALGADHRGLRLAPVAHARSGVVPGQSHVRRRTSHAGARGALRPR